MSIAWLMTGTAHDAGTVVAARVVPWVAALLTVLVGLSFGASSAWAGVTLGTSPDIPRPNGPVTVGQTNVPSRLTITNVSTDQQGTQNVAITNITLVPSCGVIASVDCPGASFDPDVFALSATGTGTAGTACAGTTFTITNIDQAQDKYLFTPSVPVVLGPADTGGLLAQCRIDFTVDVLKVPTIDARADPGIQTNELAGATGTATDGQVGQGTGTNFTTVNRATPSITTNAVTPVTIGAAITDNATVSGRVNPVAGATVTFTLFGPDNATCTGAAIFTSVVPLPTATNTVTSGAFTPTLAGSYRWIAAYSGDANNAAVTGACNDANELSVVNQAAPSIATQAVTPVTIGGGDHRQRDGQRPRAAAGGWHRDLQPLRARQRDVHGCGDLHVGRAVADGDEHGHVGCVHADGGGELPVDRGLQR